MVAMDTIFDELKQDPRMHMPIPSRETFQTADYARFNMYEVTGNNHRRPVTEDGINILLLHAWKKDPLAAFSEPGSERVTPYALQKLHVA